MEKTSDRNIVTEFRISSKTVAKVRVETGMSPSGSLAHQANGCPQSEFQGNGKKSFVSGPGAPAVPAGTVRTGKGTGRAGESGQRPGRDVFPEHKESATGQAQSGSPEVFAHEGGQSPGSLTALKAAVSVQRPRGQEDPGGREDILVSVEVGGVIPSVPRSGRERNRSAVKPLRGSGRGRDC